MPPLVLFCLKHLPIPFLNNQNPSLAKCILNSLSFGCLSGVRFIPQRRHHNPTILQDKGKKSQLQRGKGNLIRKMKSCGFLLALLFKAEIQLINKGWSLFRWQKKIYFKCYLIFLLIRLFFLSLSPCGFYNPKCWNSLEHGQYDVTLMLGII